MTLIDNSNELEMKTFIHTIETRRVVMLIIFFMFKTFFSVAQTNPLWTQGKIKNYLPHMTSGEVTLLVEKSDMVIIPVSALEQHANHLPIGTDLLNGVEICKLIAQERDILVVPVLMAGQSPYHMGFAGTITLSAETIIKVHLETVQSLLRHGFKRFVIMSDHNGNDAIVELIVDQINQTTSGVAINYYEAIEPFIKPVSSYGGHAGTGETSKSMYLIPNLVNLRNVEPTVRSLPKHLENMVQSIGSDPTARTIFLAETLKDECTGKKTSAAEMSSTGIIGPPLEMEKTNVKFGESIVLAQVKAMTQFIDKWNNLVKR